MKTIKELKETLKELGTNCLLADNKILIYETQIEGRNKKDEFNFSCTAGNAISLITEFELNKDKDVLLGKNGDSLSICVFLQEVIK